MITKYARRLFFVFMFVATIVTLPQGRAFAKADSLCIHFVGTRPGGSIRLSSVYSLSGKLPLTLCEVIKRGTDYRLFLEGTGFEKKVGIFELPVASRPRVKGIAFRAFARNLILPGWGDYYSERQGVAIINDLTVFAGLYKFISEEQKYHHLRNRLDVLNQRKSEAETFELASNIQKQIHWTVNEVNTQNRIRKRYAIVASVFYAGQLIEPFLLNSKPKARIEAGGRIVRFDMRPISRGKAAFISLIRPGKGQLYQGKVKRGTFFSLITSLTAMVALDYHGQYDWAEYRYKRIVEDFNLSDNYTEKRRLKEESEMFWDDVRKYRFRRNAAYITLAATWSWSILDSLIFPESDTGESSPLSLQVSNNMIEMCLRF